MNVIRYVGACIFMSRTSYEPGCFKVTEKSRTGWKDSSYGWQYYWALSTNPLAAECLELVDYLYICCLLAGMVCATINIITINITKQRDRDYNLQVLLLVSLMDFNHAYQEN